jgi:hypothetical protein
VVPVIIDAHAHLSNTDYGNVELYLQQMTEAGVGQAVVVPGGMMDVRKMTDYVIGRTKAENPVPDNAYIKSACADRKGVLTGFACVDPHADGAAAAFERTLKEGFKGLKLNPMTHQFAFSGAPVRQLAEICGAYGVPMYSHVLFNPGASTAKFADLAKSFPKVNFILGHTGFGPADQDGLAAAGKLNNFYLESSTGNWLHLKEIIRRAGAGKLIFGSEFPLSHPKAELEKILLLGLKGNDQDRVLGGNMLSLLPGGSKQVQNTGSVPSRPPVRSTNPGAGGRVGY